MRKTLILLAMMVLLVGCAKKYPEVLLKEVGTEQHIAITEEKIPPTPGKSDDDLIAVITVPTATIDSSGTVTVEQTIVKVFKQKKTFRETVLRKSDEPVNKIDVISNNPAVKVMYSGKMPWWYYALGTVFFAGVVTLIIRQYAGWFSKIFSILSSLRLPWKR